MTKIIIVLAVGLLTIGTAIAAQPKTMALHDAPRPLPDIAFSDEAGTPLTFNAYRGKVVLLNIWATWCGPCRIEMPTLDRLQAQLGSDRFEVVALSIDRAGAGAVRKFYDDNGIRHLVLVVDQTGRAIGDLNVLGLPATILVEPEGKEIGRLIGPAEWDTPEMLAFLKRIVQAYHARKQPL